MIPTKICGITNFSDAQCVLNHGASAIGFIFYKKSPRAISIEDAKFISNQLPDKISRIGVFVNQKNEFINDAISKVPLNMIQLHGNELPEFCNQFDIPVIKAIRVKDEATLTEIHSYNVDAILLDTFSKQQYGGTGKIFDWSFIQGKIDTPIILSGGLNSDNILDAIAFLNPSAVDINSGIESSPGIKDYSKIKHLFKKISETKKTNFRFDKIATKVKRYRKIK